jgi:predicted permease
VQLAATAYWLPIDVEDGMPFQIIGRPVKKDCCGSKWMSITPGYLKLFRIPVLRGRDFTENDKAGAPGVALINQALATQLWPDEDPVGQHILCGQGIGPELEGEPERQIIGIVADSHNSGLGRPADPMMMVPIAQVADGYAAAYSNIQPLFWLVRTHGDPHQAIPVVTEQLRLASSGFPVAHVRTMDEVMGRSTARESFNMLLLTIFGAVALVLAAIGIYGLMAYSVEQRTHEIGIRMSIGADRTDIRRLVVWHGMRLALVGVGVGIVAALGLTRLIGGFLFGVKPWDPAVFIAAPIFLSAVALAAVWLPATRASEVEPIKALHAE